MSHWDAVFYSLMAGFGETYFAAFALAGGLSQVDAGLLTSIPLIFAGIIQLLTPRRLVKTRSFRRWVVGCAVVQALSHVWFVYAALRGYISASGFFVICVIYWATSMAAGPAWNSWIESITAKETFRSFITIRSRFAQAAAFVAFCIAGFLLDFFKANQKLLVGFAVLFGLAALFRLVSALFLRTQDDYFPQDDRQTQTPWKKIFGLLRDKNAGRFLLFLLISQISVNISAPYFSPYMLGYIKFSYPEYVALISASFIMKILAYPFIGRFIERFGALRCLIVSGIFVSPLPLSWFWMPHLGPLILSQMVGGTAWATFELSSTMLVFSNIDKNDRIRVLTAYNLFNAICIVLGAACGGYFLARGETILNYRVVFITSASCRLLSLLALVGIKDVGKTVRILAFRTLGLRPGQGSISAPVLDSRDRARRMEE